MSVYRVNNRLNFKINLLKITIDEVHGIVLLRIIKLKQINFEINNVSFYLNLQSILIF